MKIALASDHAAFPTKEAVKEYLLKAGHIVTDFGTNSEESCDYPDFIAAGAKALAHGEVERGVFFCGNGIGASMTANRVKGVRAALCRTEKDVKQTRDHNDANAIVLGGREMTAAQCIPLVELFLATPFSNDPRHIRRIKKIDELT